ncbi:helix-turn-helix transcriptional regulator [Halolamina sp. CBA1230]|uniref:winged helix-turn-helix domain-containing protein n=1 Tax=Halolamina sp. CBA1230 TaxID=1853690 RepID=UPI0009A20C3F|nr:helix-turn-helix domain-containing protein [Halolamina sp. CBA1230]QKY20488.1 helix-turn-helix transcriptional regulator [Halolamina sp. CBA1230]
MDEFDPAPTTPHDWPDDADTFDRVYDVALGLTEPTSYGDVADLADCSPNAAKKHLDRLAEMGIVRADTEARPAHYERNDGYLEWQEASRIAHDLTVDEIIDRVRELEAERDHYEERFDATDPDTVSVFDDNHETVHERMEAVSDWQRIDRDIRLYELARQLAQNDGHLISA